MRKLQEPNYKLMINTDSYTGNFERELIAYVFGILDSVQMEIEHSEKYREAFYTEESMTLEQCEEFLEEYLFERYQEVDDWEQMTFYEICRFDSDKCNSLAVFLDKTLNEEWMERFKRRLQKFFNGGYEEVENARWQEMFGHNSYVKPIKLLSVKLLKCEEGITQVLNIL